MTRNPNWPLAAIALAILSLGAVLVFRALKALNGGKSAGAGSGVALLLGGLMLVMGLLLLVYSLDLQGTLGA